MHGKSPGWEGEERGQSLLAADYRNGGKEKIPPVRRILRESGCVRSRLCEKSLSGWPCFEIKTRPFEPLPLLLGLFIQRRLDSIIGKANLFIRHKSVSRAVEPFSVGFRHEENQIRQENKEDQNAAARRLPRISSSCTHCR